MGETFDEVKMNSEKALEALRKMKKIEKETEMHTMRLNKNTIVFCKNKDKLQDYKKI